MTTIRTQNILPRVNDDFEQQVWRETISAFIPEQIEANGTTTDGTQKSIASISLESDTIYGLEWWVIASLRETSGSEQIGSTGLWVWRGGARLDGSGDSEWIDGSPDLMVDLQSRVFGVSSSGWATQLAVVTGTKNVTMLVTGLATDVIRWKVKAFIYT